MKTTTELKRKSIRLNVTIRDEIKNNIKKAYGIANKRPVVSDNRETDLKDAVVEAYMEADKPLHDYYNESLFQKQFNTYNCVEFRKPNGNHSYAYLPIISEEGEPVKRMYLPMSHNNVFFDMMKDEASGKYTQKLPKVIMDVIRKNEKLRKKIRKETSVQSEYDRKLTEYIKSVVQILAGVNTTGQLLEVWPEVEKFLPQVIVDPSRVQLPAVSIKAMNEMLG